MRCAAESRGRRPCPRATHGSYPCHNDLARLLQAARERACKTYWCARRVEATLAAHEPRSQRIRTRTRSAGRLRRVLPYAARRVRAQAAIARRGAARTTRARAHARRAARSPAALTRDDRCVADRAARVVRGPAQPDDR